MTPLEFSLQHSYIRNTNSNCTETYQIHSRQPKKKESKNKISGLTRGAAVHAVDAQGRILIGQLPGFDLGEGAHGGEATVLGQGQGYGLEGVGERPEGILLERADLVGARCTGKGASYLSRTTAVHDPVVHHEVTHRAEGIVNRALRLLDDLRTKKNR